MLQIASINSGSNGNCYYVGNATEAVLVDAGLTCRETEKRMERIGLKMNHVKAIFISHEHHDHIKGVEVISSKYKLPVYITDATCRNGKLNISPDLCRSFNAHQKIQVGSLSISAFTKAHDAIDPHSFMVTDGKINIGVFTDIGMPCAELINSFRQCHAAFLESNYDEEMLAAGNYPYYLKRRINGGNGHLSNRQAFDLFIKHRPSHMSHLLLSHLSKNNNCPELVKGLFSSHSSSTNILIASRYQESELISVNAKKPKPILNTCTTQMKLFEELF